MRAGHRSSRDLSDRFRAGKQRLTRARAAVQRFGMSSQQVQQLIGQAARSLQQGDRTAYLRHIAEVLALDPDEPQARNAMGREALAANDFKAAADHFRAAAGRDPQALPLWINLAAACRGCADDEGERQALEAALNIDRLNLAALVRLAQLHERRGEEAQALEHWGAVASLRSQHMDAPADVQALFAHAQAYVGERNRTIADQVDAAIADQLAHASTRDRRRAAAAKDVLTGRRSVYLNAPEGFHYPFLPADEYFDREHFPWLDKLEAATDMIREELKAILASSDPGLQPYVQMDGGLPESKWTALDHNLDWSSLHLWREGERVDEACARAPKTAALIESLPLCDIPGRAPTAFFSILKAGKHIPPHTGVTNIRTIIHLPLIVPSDCGFRVGGETREWREGEAFAFDDSIEHEAWNRSDQDRAILIIDTWNPHLSDDERAMIRTMFQAADAAGFNPRA